MKAVIITRPGPPDVLMVQDVEDPEPSAEEILVRVRATAVNRADCMQREGKYPAPPGVRQDIPGLEYAGEVLEVGAAVRDWKPGDRVMGLVAGAGYAEKVVTHERLALPIPDNLDFPEAATIPEVFITAYDALFPQLHLQIGESLLIHAAGSGVGTAAIQLAKSAGAIVYGTAGSDEKLTAARTLGLDIGINYKKQDFYVAIQAETNNEGVHAILDLVGAQYWTRNLECLASGGRMIIVGLLSGRTVETNLGTILRKRLTILGTALRSRTLEEKAMTTQDFGRHCLPLFASGRVHPVVDREFPLEEAGAAHAHLESNRTFGKIVLRVS